MENRMRDLEQIQERDPSDSGTRLGGVLMATAAMVALTFAIGVLVGQAAEPTPQAPDPLALLERAGAVAAPQDAPTAAPAVAASDLTFARRLSDQEERPEVLAALAAAEAEARELGESRGAAAAPQADLAEEPSQPGILADQAAPRDLDVAAVLPAAVAAGSVGKKLPKSALHDPMVAAAIPEESAAAPAAVGSEGAFSLQVISYEDASQARDFAEGLRARGHSAFVTHADLPERGRYYRVRIGPFKSRPEADAYRRKFEADEGMNTFVVKRPRDEEPG